MPPRPFTFPLSIGTDVVHIHRVKAILERTKTDTHRQNRFLRRFLSLREQVEFYRRFQVRDGHFASRLDEVSKHLAGRWAAKEAIIKAVSWRRLSFLDIHIHAPKPGAALEAVVLDTPDTASTGLLWNSKWHNNHSDSDGPLHVSDASDASGYIAAGQRYYDGLSGQVAKISISHDGDYATAVCLVQDESSFGDYDHRVSTLERSK